MVISAEKLNQKYLTFCENKKLNSNEKDSTKAFMDSFMLKNKFNHVQLTGTNYTFSLKLRVMKQKTNGKA